MALNNKACGPRLRGLRYHIRENQWVYNRIRDLGFLDFEEIAEGLVICRDNLHFDRALGNWGDFCQSLLIGLQFPVGELFPVQLHLGASLDESHDDACTVDRPASGTQNLNLQGSHRHAPIQCRSEHRRGPRYRKRHSSKA